MNSNIGLISADILFPVSNYAFLTHLEKIYTTPWSILTDFTMPLCKKQERILRWYTERSRYFLEHGWELDVQLDTILADLEKAISLLRHIEESLNVRGGIKARSTQLIF